MSVLYYFKNITLHVCPTFYPLEVMSYTDILSYKNGDNFAIIMMSRITTFVLLNSPLEHV